MTERHVVTESHDILQHPDDAMHMMLDVALPHPFSPDVVPNLLLLRRPERAHTNMVS